MARDQITRVRASWTLIVPVAETVAAGFYERLFALDPSLRPLFVSAEPAAQQRKFVQTLALVVASIDDFSRLLPAVETLGRRHVGYGVTDGHYQTVGQALLGTLERVLGAAFDHPTCEAWAAAYDILSGAMRNAVATREPDQPLVPSRQGDDRAWQPA